jgi:hypothetical protein
VTRRRAPARTRPFREPFDALRRQLDTMPADAVVADARDRHPVLDDGGSVEVLLARMADENAHSWTEREALTRAFLAEHQRDAGRGVWSALLLLAYFPMLSHLRHRLRSETLDSQDLDSLVITSFLEVIATLDLNAVRDRTAMQLRQRTQRKVFRRLRRTRAEQRHVTFTAEIPDRLQEQVAAEPPDPSDIRDPEQTIARLLDVAGQELPPDQLDLVVATMLRKERLRSYAQRCAADGEPIERVYQRLKRRRARALDRLRSLISRSQHVAGTGDTSTPV